MWGVGPWDLGRSGFSIRLDVWTHCFVFYFFPKDELFELFFIGLLLNSLIISIARLDFYQMLILLEMSGLDAWLRTEIQCVYHRNLRPKAGCKAGLSPSPALLCTCALLIPHAILSIIKNRNACSLQCHCVLGILHRAWQLDWVQQRFVELNKATTRSCKISSWRLYCRPLS